MVMCDVCSAWHHYICVDETEGICDRDWTCSKCLEKSRKKSSGKGSATSTAIKNQDQEARLGLLREKLEFKQKFALQRLELQEKLEHQYLEEKYKLTQDISAESVFSSDENFGGQETMRRIQNWISDVDKCGGGDGGDIASQAPSQSKLHDGRAKATRLDGHPNTSLRDFSQGARETSPHNMNNSSCNVFLPEQKSTPHGQRKSSENHGQLETFVLNRSQLAARQAVHRELPEFSGNPEDWPLFYCTFSSSSAMCGFTNEENMLRLRNCLKGRALDAVRCRLLHPSNVNGVISTLKMLFGNPESIVHAIILKIRKLPPPDMTRLETLVNFSLSVENLCATIEACGVHDFMYDASLRYELIEKLPSDLAMQWAKHARNLTVPKLSDLSSWLHTEAEDASSILITPTSSQRSRRNDRFLNLHSGFQQQESQQNITAKTKQRGCSKESAPRVCGVCKGSCEMISKCERFAELSYDAKWDVLKELQLCKKCLRRHSGTCRMQKICGVNGCTYKHHPLMHKKLEVKPSTATPGNYCNIHQLEGDQILFRIVPVILYGSKTAIRTFAFLDDGSELTLIEESLANELDLQGPQKSLCLKWTGDTRRFEDRSKVVNLRVSGSNKSFERSYSLSEVRTVRELNLPKQSLITTDMKRKYPHLNNIPFESYRDAVSRILIGLDHAHLGNAFKTREGRFNQPIAVKSRLGWIVFGNCAETEPASFFVNMHSIPRCECNDDDSLQKLVKNYFSLDSIGISHSSPLMSTYDQKAIDMLNFQMKSVAGRYEVGLLWKYEHVRLPNSRDMALRRWQCLDRRLSKDEKLATLMEEKIQDYLRKGYIRKLDKKELVSKQPRVWYLPIFPVVNPNKPGKLRIVWDAAAKAHGVSLNSVLLKGPDQMSSLFSILLKFREYKIAFSGDIREMYHQVLIREADQQCQRFFWKSNADSIVPSEYVMRVMTFGASCSPCSALFVKNANARKFQKEFPQAVDVIINQHYVDDALVSVEDEDDAIRIAKEVYEIHRSGGFEIRNWVSNSRRFLKALPGPNAAEKSMSLSSELGTEKILGMFWNTASDKFTFKLSSRHDPDLLNVVQMHTFVDASESGFATAVFLRFEENGNVECTLVGSKTRVSPLKFLTIPRSELQAGLLGARLATNIVASLSIEVHKQFFWTDSRNLLSWLKSDHRRYSQFVGTRVSEILELTNLNEWYWIPTKDNVADDGTKWKGVPDTSSSSRWFRGPPFLYKPAEEWPNQPKSIDNTNEELRPKLLLQIATHQSIVNIENFSCWRRLYRSTAMVIRAVNEFRSLLHPSRKNMKPKRLNPDIESIPPLNREELVAAQNLLYKEVQICTTADEYTLLKESSGESPKVLPKSSKLYRLSPFVDTNGVMRIHSRTKTCQYTDLHSKNPIVLPREHHMTRLVVQHFHKNLYHRNHETAINQLRLRYYIPKLRVVYRTMRGNCQRCKNEKASPEPPPMADLPEARLAAFCRPFTHAGIDYFGPMLVVVHRRSEKRWGVLITCMTTRAIYIDLVQSLSTDSCIMALRMFMVRRGVPRLIYSDQGTNFRGAAKELVTELEKMNQDALVSAITSTETTWKFNPPASPHMGGAWERLIQTVKKNLQSISLSRVPREEVLRCALVEIEVPRHYESSGTLLNL
ncbi:uncharacterized protein LOC129741485 [Uranotaenia lowii]|uniref:uncharacterized protein LOC129741485 n=1 Tax=Uranotaenia lowii TaxID=190385 RepID=UPI002479D1D6|nr:uncharacterized protein LOC129741485 [Uranotaenia lowii]